MMWIVLVIAIANLGLGFALAVYLGPPAAVTEAAVTEDAPESETTSDTPPPPEPAPAPQAPAPTTSTLEEEEVEQVSEEIPDEWLHILEEEGLASNSFVEASVQVLRLEVGKYRDELIHVDDQVRTCATSPDSELIQKLLCQLKDLNENWLAQQAEASLHLSTRAGTLGEFQQVGAGLENVLEDQAQQIETLCNNVDDLDIQTDIPAGCQHLIVEIRKLIDLAHDLRDRMHDSLLAIIKAENRLGELERQLQFDSLTGIHNRSGLERLLDDLWYNDPNRIRQVSCGMVDIDQFASLLEKHGAVACDRILVSFSALFSDLIRKDRGMDIPARFDGQRFFVIFGDTGPRNATSAIERVRQTIQNSSFEWNGEEIELTVSCGVVEVLSEDTTEDLFSRLLEALKACKHNGRNCTYLDVGGGPASIEAPDYEAKGRVLRVG